MKRQVLAIAIGSLVALPAFATDGEIGVDYRTVSSKTSAQVQAELVAAQRSGELAMDGEIGQTAHASPTGKTRAEVVAEVIDAGFVLVDGETGERIRS